MPAYSNKDLCCYCGGCAAVCPFDAIRLRETYIEVDAEKCKECGACVKVCPVGAMVIKK